MLNVRNPRTDVLQLRVWDADTISKDRGSSSTTLHPWLPWYVSYVCTLQDDDIGHVARSLVAWISTYRCRCDLVASPSLVKTMALLCLTNLPKIWEAIINHHHQIIYFRPLCLVYSSIARTFLCVNSYDVAVAAMLNDPQQRRLCVLKIWNLAEIALGIEHDQCPLKRFFGEIFSVIYDQYAGIPVKHVQVKVFQLQCLIPSQGQDTIGFWFAVRRKTRLCIVAAVFPCFSIPTSRSAAPFSSSLYEDLDRRRSSSLLVCAVFPKE